jgi:hypothetical protein
VPHACRSRIVRSIGTFVLLFCLHALTAHAQLSGVIAGRVLHSVTKEPIPGAVVVLTGSGRGLASDGHGWFVFRDVPAGMYGLRISMLGFRPAEVDSLRVERGSTLTVAVELTESEIGMAEVLVVNRRTVSFTEFPVSTQSISFREMKQSAGAMEDVARVVNAFPGVAQVDRDRNEVMVRGGAPSENLFLVDNFELPNINHFGIQGASGGAVSFINMDFLESFSFATGGFGVRYGDKMSSVFDIRLRRGREDRAGGKVMLSATQFGLTGEGPMPWGGTILASVRRSFLEPVFQAYGMTYAPAYWDYALKMQQTLGSNDHLRILALGALDRVELDNSTPEARRENSKTLFGDQYRHLAGLAWKHVWSSGVAEVQARHLNTRYHYLQFRSDLTPSFKGNAVEEETAVKADVLLRLSSTTEVSAGAEWKTAFLAADLYANVSYTAMTPRVVYRIDGRSDTNAAKSSAYLQLAHAIGRLTVTAGVRGDHFGMLSQPLAIAPRISLSYAFDHATRLTASAGRYFQAPAYLWIMSNGFNRGLSHLVLDQVVAGVDHYFDADWKVTVEGYRKWYGRYPASIARPYLVMVNTGVGLGGVSEGYASFGLDSLVSRGTGMSHGAEVFVQKRLSDTPWFGKLTLSYNVTSFRALDGVWRPSDYDQRWIATMGGGYLFGEDWEFSGLLRFYTGRPYTPFFGPTIYVRSSDLYNTERVGNNHSLDVRVARYWSWGSHRWSAFVDIINVYNRRPIDVPYFDSGEQRVKQRPTIGIVPSAGISVEF